VVLGVIGLGVGGWVLFGGVPGGSSTETTEPTGPVVGAAAPSFNTRLLDGGTFSLDAHLSDDGRPVILNFWASWCTPCVAEMPSLDAAAEANPAVLVLGVAADDTEASASSFADEIGVGYPLGIDTTGIVAADYHVFGLPATYAIGSDGRIKEIAYGELDEVDIEALIASATG
jgi:thiol-disulfide isomerase/thioredoxin